MGMFMLGILAVPLIVGLGALFEFVFFLALMRLMHGGKK